MDTDISIRRLATPAGVNKVALNESPQLSAPFGKQGQQLGDVRRYASSLIESQRIGA
jgi:hypothetical protein